MQSRRSPEQISAELKLPFCGHRCLLDHCGAKREMNVKIIHDASCFHSLFQGSDELTSVLVSLKIHPVSEDLFTPFSLYSCFCVLSVIRGTVREVIPFTGFLFVPCRYPYIYIIVSKQPTSLPEINEGGELH